MMRKDTAAFVASMLLIGLLLFAWKLQQNLYPPSGLSLSSVAAVPASVGGDTGVDTFVPKRQSKFENCKAVGGYPDPLCTPGAIFVSATKEDICTSGYSKKVRDVPESEKKAVYAEYGVLSHAPGEYEVDHFISLELGGSNDISNLFPESAEPRPGFHEKDKVENYLHAEVCSGAMSLSQAQISISTDWLAVYSQIK